MAVHKAKAKAKDKRKPKGKSRYRMDSTNAARRSRSTTRKGSRRQSKRDAERVLWRGPIRTRPKDQALPGLEHLRIKPLDDICASISDTRAQQNDLRAEEAGLEQTALHLMRKHTKTAWRAHGVELVRVPGEEKLRVRTSREKATAETEPENTDAGEELPGGGDELHAMDTEDGDKRDGFGEAM